MPGRITPAFSAAMAASVSPRYCWWSKAIDVMAAQGLSTFVLSTGGRTEAAAIAHDEGLTATAGTSGR